VRAALKEETTTSILTRHEPSVKLGARNRPASNWQLVQFRLRGSK
jgi:hypothetical protein